VLKRLREYFKELLNPVEQTHVDNTLVASINATEPDILIADVERVIKRESKF
jgi:ABC-type enterochelin transport system permease subunit